MVNISESINLLNFPLNIAIVDDDIDYLTMVQQQIKRSSLSTYSSPMQALKNINPINISPKYFLEENFSGILDLNYKNIKTFAKNCGNMQGILIADYSMPYINGIELFSKYKNFELIKILLTGAFKIEEALDALHKKLINYYLPKERISILLEVIGDLEQLFFENVTRSIISVLDTSSLNFLSDKIYANIFNEICSKHDIKKYYILNSYGHYYLENDINKFIFSIYNTADLSEIAKEVPGLEKYNVEQGNLIPSYFSNEFKLINANKYGNYSYSVEQII